MRIEKQYQDLETERQRLSKERSEMLYDATVDCLRKNFRNLMGCQNEASFDKLVSSIASPSNPQNEGTESKYNQIIFNLLFIQP